jgi:hypothetical protein
MDPTCLHFIPSSPNAGTVRVPYKVAIPLGRVKTAKPSENKDRPEQKYVQVRVLVHGVRQTPGVPAGA